MSKQANIAFVVGSLRKASLSRKVANALIELAPGSLACSIVEIGDLPLYNEDLDGDPPASWTRLRDALARADGIVFVTPEYNRSIPGCLKNAVDVASRPEGKSVLDGKAAGVVSVTPYKLGAFGANHALRQTFVFLNLLVLQQPEVYLGNAKDLFDERGAVKSPETAALLGKFLTAFDRWVATVKGGAHAGRFDAFMKQRAEAASAYVNGDTDPLAAMLTHRDPATFLSPGGDHATGAGAIAARYAKDAEAFSEGSTSRLEVLQSDASGQLAFWTGLQHAEVKMDGKTVAMTLRITEVFRLEGGAWMLVHRHADMGKPR